MHALKFRATLASGALALYAVTSHASPVVVVDQTNDYFGSAFNIHVPHLIWAQEIRTGLAGQLLGVELYYLLQGARQDFRVFINRGSSWQTDADDYSLVVPAPSSMGWFIVDLAAAALNFGAEETFLLGVQGIGPDAGCCNLGGSADNYARGQFYRSSFGFPSIRDDTDLAFRTHMSVNAVPEPQPWALLLAGLGLLGWSRRSQRS